LNKFVEVFTENRIVERRYKVCKEDNVAMEECGSTGRDSLDGRIKRKRLVGKISKLRLKSKQLTWFVKLTRIIVAA
jgi:hypothetical protein